MSEKEFHITPKSTHAWLASRSDLKWQDVKIQIATDMMANAHELTQTVNWGVVWDAVEAVHDQRRYKGKFALVHSLAETVGSVAIGMGWDMHSPEVVYMSGYHPVWALGQRLARLNHWREEVEDGTRTFTDEEQREAAIEENDRQTGMLGTFRSRINWALDQYALQNLKGEPHLRALRYLLYSGGKTSYRRYPIMDALRIGNVGEASQLISRS